MTTINTESEPTHAYSSPEGTLPPQDNALLLDEPLGGQYDNISALYVLLAADAHGDAQSSMEAIEQANQQRAEAWDRQLQALQQAREAKEDDSFWGSLGDTFGTIAKVAGVVGACALAVGSMGAATPVAALAIGAAICSSASLAQSELGVMDSVFGEKLADKIGLGLGIGGALMGLGAGGFALFGEASTATEAASAAEQIATPLAHGAAIVAGGSAIVAGTSAVVLAHNNSEAAHHQADATRAYLDAQLLQFLLTQLVEDFAETKERETSNVQRITAMNEMQGSAMTAAAGGIA